MKRLFGVLILLIAVAKLAHGTNLPHSRVQSSLRKTEQINKHTRSADEDTPTIHQFALNNVAPAYRSQTQRLSSPVKIYFTSLSGLTTYHNTLKYFFPHRDAGYVRWCKLVLFPFHDFW